MNDTERLVMVKQSRDKARAENAQDFAMSNPNYTPVDIRKKKNSYRDNEDPGRISPFNMKFEVIKENGVGTMNDLDRVYKSEWCERMIKEC